MNNWKKYKLGGVINLKRGYDLPQQNRIHGNIPIYSSAGLSGYHNEFKVKGPGVITGRYGTLGELFYTDENYWPHNTTLYVTDFKGNYPKFIYYFLKTLRLDNQNDKTSVPGLNRNHLHEIEVAIPEDINEQQRIASILSSLDDKIELNRRMNQTLEQIAATLFKKYFVDDIDPDNLPEGWRWGKLIELCRNFDSKRIPLSSRQREEKKGIYPYYGAASIMDYVDDYLFDGLYILLGEDGTVVDEKGFPVLQYAWGRFWVNNHAHVLQGKGISTNHLYMILKNSPIAHLVTGAVQPKISQGNLNSLQVLIPSKETNSKFDTEINSLFSLIRNNSEQIRTLQKTRDSLLPKLMSGEIDVTAINQNEPLNEEVLI